ncbi:MAG TPA: S4 domain-containing protein YaaA [Acholeplasmatales bacterium]|nr:S4 domain-containing protein YaaA [Bacillota bacterium]HAQ57351.1 S4 domain-containing protein YaaA [Acholeplasmatales bacterium]
MKTIDITTEYITLGQLLKFAAVLQSGGEVKSFLAEVRVTVNDEPENRRGRKLYPGDRITVFTKPRVDLEISR